jgi:type VI secretion system protein ImpF
MSERLPRAGRDRIGERDRTDRIRAARAQLPLLERLIDAAPDETADPPVSAAAAMEVLRTSIRADLEALLNTRRRWQSWDPSLTQLDNSLVGFGLPDFAAGAFNDPRRREELRALVETCIRHFEPRIASLSVTLVDTPDNLSATFRLRIEAVMYAEPAPEPITFDTLVDPVTMTMTVLARDT